MRDSRIFRVGILAVVVAFLLIGVDVAGLIGMLRHEGGLLLPGGIDLIVMLLGIICLKLSEPSAPVNIVIRDRDNAIVVEHALASNHTVVLMGVDDGEGA